MKTIQLNKERAALVDDDDVGRKRKAGTKKITTKKPAAAVSTDGTGATFGIGA